MYKRIKVNFLSQLSNELILMALIAVLGGLYTLGYGIGKNSSEASMLREEITHLKDSISRITPSLNIPDKVSSNNTNNNNNPDTNKNNHNDSVR